MHVADSLVSDSICCASTFERYRIGNLYGLCRRPFRFPQSSYRFAKGDVCCCIYLSARALICQATPDIFRSVCPPASWRLKISFQLDIERFVFSRP